MDRHVAAQIVFIDQFATVPAPTGIDVGPTGDIYVVNSSDNTVNVLSPTGSTITSFSAGGASPAQDIAVSPANDWITVTHQAGGSVRMRTNGAGLTSLTGTAALAQVAMTDDFAYLHVSSGPFVSYSRSLWSANTLFNLSSSTTDLAVSDSAYFLLFSTLVKYDLSGVQLASISSPGGSSGGLTISDAGYVYMTSSNTRLRRYDKLLSAGSEIIAPFAVGSLNGHYVAAAPNGYVYTTSTSNNVVMRYFDPDSWMPNTTLIVNAPITMTSAFVVPEGATILRDGANPGAINARFTAPASSVIEVKGSTLTLGSASSPVGFSTMGDVRFTGPSGNAGVLQLASGGLARLGGHTNLGDGGTIVAANGISLPAGAVISGRGQVQARIAAGIGSTIQATGGLTLGASATNGFISDGELYTGANTVTINDSNEAVLGSLTSLGDGTNVGTLMAGAAMAGDTKVHFLISEGKNLVGRGTVTGNVKNNGHVVGDGVGLNERITFDAGWTVNGIGSFDNVLFNGTFAPGLSPGVVDGNDMAVGGELKMEIGGLTPGNGPGHHDQVNDAGSFEIGGTAKLSIASYGGFLPPAGQEFTIVTSGEAIAGAFDHVTVDPWFIAHGVSFNLEATSNAVLAEAVAVSGDFTLDGVIDGADFLAWQRSVGTQGANLAADADKNGLVDQADLNIWNIQYAAAQGTVFASVTAVPEPVATALAVMAALALPYASRKRRSY
jgi:hypothetical protein